MPDRQSEQFSEHLDALVKALPQRPGVYRMFDAAGKLLYVGKAKQLRRRVGQYFSKQLDSAKTAALVSRIADIQTTVTNTESEALLLEQTLIKQHRPPFNILLKDDKSYPYISLDMSHPYPRLSYYRGKTLKPGPQYYGPFVQSGAIVQALNLFQKMYQIRQCEDVFFNNRSRPCLQHQIGRCSAPCVGRISEEAYGHQIQQVKSFLEGKATGLIEGIVDKMEHASEQQDYEAAAQYRDQIAFLRVVQSRQFVAGQAGDVDAISVVLETGVASVNVLHVRSGTVVGHQHHLMKAPLFKESVSDEEAHIVVLQAFIPQFYMKEALVMGIAPQICLELDLPDKALLSELLSKQAGRKVEIISRVKSTKAAWLKMSRMNASERLISHLGQKNTQMYRLEALRSDLNLADMPLRIECFDISHTAGESTVASCVVFEMGGPKTSDYRRFNVENITPGDDYAAMAQAVGRRYQRQIEREARLPDVIVIDGGPGQLKMAWNALEELQMTGSLLISVAKGEGRKFGRERFYRATTEGKEEFSLSSDAFSLIGHIRDEAHRFAIKGHRSKRDRKRIRSALEDIPGIGPKRRRLLLTHFGGIQGLRQAGATELTQLPGISPELAERIVESLRAE